MQNFIKFEGDSCVKIMGINSTGDRGANKFDYDRVFDSDSTQADMYEQAVKPIVLAVMDGFNGTVFAYG